MEGYALCCLAHGELAWLALPRTTYMVGGLSSCFRNRSSVSKMATHFFIGLLSPDGEGDVSACCRSCCSPSTPGDRGRGPSRPAAHSAPATPPTRWVRCAHARWTRIPWTWWTWWSWSSPPSTQRTTLSCRCAASAGGRTRCIQ